MINCPYCGNTYSISLYCENTYSVMSQSNMMYYCPKCNSYFNKYGITLNASTAAIENDIDIRLPKAANANKGSCSMGSKGSNIFQPQEWNELTINAKDIIINDDKISITIDKNNIDKNNIGKFNVIEINGVKFVRKDS